jgi:flavin reductase (DIM6/NTAB) family NADH-FMN oxidoreductase RutF
MTYRTFDVAEIGHQQAYRLAIGSIVPRPIAWVSSMGADGVPNLAPFSFFTLVSHFPPMVSISVGERERKMKDTARNIEATKGYVIHTVVDSWEDKMNASSADFAPEEDEFAAIGLETIPSDLVDAPRLAGAPVAMECRFDRLLELGDEWKTHLVIGRVLRWHVREDVMLDDKYIDPQKLAPVGRLGGPRYSRTHDIFEMQAPFVTPDRGHPNDPKT